MGCEKRAMQPEGIAVLGRQGDFEAQGRSMGFFVRVGMDTGRVFEEQQSVFVAAHDPSKERRRNPVDWGT